MKRNKKEQVTNENEIGVHLGDEVRKELRIYGMMAHFGNMDNHEMMFKV